MKQISFDHKLKLTVKIFVSDGVFYPAYPVSFDHKLKLTVKIFVSDGVFYPAYPAARDLAYPVYNQWIEQE